MRCKAPALAALASLSYCQDIDVSLLKDSAPSVRSGPSLYAVNETPSEVYDRDKAIAYARGNPIEPSARQPNGQSKRDLSPCSLLPTGAGPVPSPDNAEAFLAHAEFAEAAHNAEALTGYTAAFTNLDSQVHMSTYLGLYSLDSYNVTQCSHYCDNQPGCLGFNVHFERQPAVVPDFSCPNPPSSTYIKCTLWGSEVTSASANNDGQLQGPPDSSGSPFKVVTAGSNGYNRVFTPASETGYTGPVALRGSINSTTWWNSTAGMAVDIFIGTHFFAGPYNPTVCSALCNSTTSYMYSRPNNTDFQPCNFFNAYLLSDNDVPQGMYCALYSRPVDASKATVYNDTHNGHAYTVSQSFSFTLYPQVDDVDGPVPGKEAKRDATLPDGKMWAKEYIWGTVSSDKWSQLVCDDNGPAKPYIRHSTDWKPSGVHTWADIVLPKCRHGSGDVACIDSQLRVWRLYGPTNTNYEKQRFPVSCPGSWFPPAYESCLLRSMSSCGDYGAWQDQQYSDDLGGAIKPSVFKRDRAPSLPGIKKDEDGCMGENGKGFHHIVGSTDDLRPGSWAPDTV